MPMVVEAFNAANPDIHLTYMPDVGNVDDGTLQAVLQSGLGPDIIGTGSGAGPDRAFGEKRTDSAD